VSIPFDFKRRLIVSVSISLAVAAAAAFVVVVLIRTRPSPEQTQPKPQPLRVRTYRVQPRDIIERVVGYGSVRSMRRTNLTAEVPGTLIYRDPAARAGQSVKAGFILFRIDPRDYQHQISQLTEQIEATKAQLEQLDLEEANSKKVLAIAEREFRIASDEFDRVLALWKEKTAAKRERDQAQAALFRAERILEQSQFKLQSIKPRRQALQANLRSFRSQLEVARLNLQRCAVQAPFDGQIVAINGEVGQTVQPGFVLAVLTDPLQLEIPVELPASARPLVSRQAPASIEPETGQHGQWRGHVARLDAEIDPTSRTFKAYVEVDDPQTGALLVPGAFVRVTILGPTYADALAVPRSALRSNKVFVASDGRAQRRMIDVKRIVGDWAVVQGGLQVADQVIVTNLGVLYDGTAVQVANGLAKKEP